MMIFLYVVLGLLLALVLLYTWLYLKLSTHLPRTFPTSANSPKPSPTQQTVLCLGDSNTHGNVSYDWVTALEQQLPTYRFVNAGRNSDLTYTLLRRLEVALACQPDCITLLIGTNDVNATMSEALLKRYRRIKRIDEQTTPTLEGFRDTYQQIVWLLKERTSARIAVMSLPLMGEDLTHEANQKADRYSECIRQIAEKEGLTYLPLREQQKAYLLNNPSQSKHTFEETYKLLTVSALLHYVLGWSWNRIATHHGYRLSPDNLHQNEVAGGMIQDLVAGFVLST